MNTTSDSNTYFCVCFGGEEMKFGVPTTMAQKIVESTMNSGRKAKVNLATVIENGEKAIIDAFRMKLHRNQNVSKRIAPFIISCCLLSKEALENPDACGFILEISHSRFPSWSADANELVPDDVPGKELKTYVHYGAMAGRDEIDAFVASRHAEASG
jgi:hypothetical protein